MMINSLHSYPTQDKLVAAMDFARDALEEMLREFSEAESPRVDYLYPMRPYKNENSPAISAQRSSHSWSSRWHKCGYR